MELAVNSSPVTMQALCPGFILTEFHDVVRMDRSRIPAAWWMTADFVVEDSLRGFDRGELFVVPGMRYKLLVWILRLLPGGLIRWGSIRTAQRFKQPKKPG